jgi:hypothetical protein
MAEIATLYRREEYGGRKGRSASRKLRRLELGRCPTCNARLESGYGLCGGGCGGYTFCTRDMGHYFDKVQDRGDE